MTTKVSAALWRLIAFVVACSLAIFVLVAVFGQLRYQKGVTYRATFTNVSSLEKGNFVRIAGVEVGKVTNISINPDSTVAVEFSTDDSVRLTHGTRALIRYQDVLNRRFLELQEGAGALTPLQPGQTIPVSQTEPALDLDALIGGFRPLFRALDPGQVNALTGQLIEALQGEGDAISAVLTQVTTLTATLADRDELIGQVITNLSSVLGTLGNDSKQLDKTLDSAAQLVHALEQRKADVTNAVAYGNALAGTTADLLTRGRPGFQSAIHQTDRTADAVLAEGPYLDNLIKILPDAYKALGRQSLYGDFFSFYTCEILLKVNGKGGQPFYVQMTKQSSGRCTPR